MRRDPSSGRRTSRAIGAASCAAAAILLLAGCRTGPVEEGKAAEAPLAVEGVPEEHLSPAVAVVNGVTVYRSTYEEILQVLRNRIQPGDPDSVERYLGAKFQALEKAIDEELLHQEAVRSGFGPSTAEIRAAYGRVVAEAGSEEAFLASSGSRGVSKSEVLDSIRRTLAIDGFVKAEIESKISPTDEELRALYESRPDLFTPDPAVKVGLIFVQAPIEMPASRRAQALSRISAVYDKLHQGRSFESLAREYSEDASALEGGILGLVAKGTLPEKLDLAAFALEPGQVSDIIEAEAGYHIIKVYERQGGVLKPFDEVGEEARQIFFQRRRGQMLSATIRRLRVASTIERLLT